MWWTRPLVMSEEGDFQNGLYWLMTLTPGGIMCQLWPVEADALFLNCCCYFPLPLYPSRHRVEHRSGGVPWAAEPDAERHPDHPRRRAEEGEQGRTLPRGFQGLSSSQVCGLGFALLDISDMICLSKLVPKSTDVSGADAKIMDWNGCSKHSSQPPHYALIFAPIIK